MAAKLKQLWFIVLLAVLSFTTLQLFLYGRPCLQHQLIIEDDTNSQGRKGNNRTMLYSFPDSTPRDVMELQNRKIPFVFHYVLCSHSKRHLFTFNHYLSVVSVWRNFEPDGIEIHYKGEITQDKYNSWLHELNQTIPTLSLQKVPDYWNLDDACAPSYGLAVLQDRGGVLMSSDVILTKHSQRHLETNFSLLLDNSNVIKVIFSAKKHKHLNYIKISKNATLYSTQTSDAILEGKCSRDVDSGFNYMYSPCLFMTSAILPKDLFNTSTNQKSYLFHLFENKPVIHEPNATSESHRKSCSGNSEEVKIPKIVHYIWFHSVSLTYMMYLSLNSTLHIVKPHSVFIHTDLHIHGEYWDQIKTNPKITLVYRESPLSIYGHRIKYTTHGSDVARADILFKYGGVYIDWDVIWIKPIDDLITSGFPVIVNFDHMVATVTFPVQLNMGVTIAEPRAQFIQKWREGFVNYRTDDFYYNALELPYKIYERFPELLQINTKLQVMCFRLKCHPIFHKDHRDWTRHQPFDWREVYSLHFTYPDPHEFASEAILLKSRGLFADVGRHVLYESGHDMIRNRTFK